MGNSHISYQSLPSDNVESLDSIYAAPNFLRSMASERVSIVSVAIVDCYSRRILSLFPRIGLCAQFDLELVWSIQ